MSQHHDAPHLPQGNPDIAGTLAEHVRQYATNDPEVAALRDHLASTAQGYVDRHNTPPAGPDGPFAQTSPEPSADGSESVDEGPWEVLPHGRDSVLTKDGDVAKNRGGLWTVTYAGNRPPQQFGHAYFAATQGPFRAVPPS